VNIFRLPLVLLVSLSVLLPACKEGEHKEDDECAYRAGDDCIEQAFAHKFADESTEQPIAHPTAYETEYNVENQSVARTLEEFAGEKATQATYQTCDDNA
jgi:hypothetical protein